MDTLYGSEVRDAEVLRALDVMCESWESDSTSISEMTDQLNEACKVVAGDITFNQFAESTNLSSLARLS